MQHLKAEVLVWKQSQALQEEKVRWQVHASDGGILGILRASIKPNVTGVCTGWNSWVPISANSKASTVNTQDFRENAWPTALQCKFWCWHRKPTRFRVQPRNLQSFEADLGMTTTEKFCHRFWSVPERIRMTFPKITTRSNSLGMHGLKDTELLYLFY